MEKQDLRLVYVYDSCGTLLNMKPFVGFESVFKFIGSKVSLFIDSSCIPDSLKNDIKFQCRPNGDMIVGYYFRTRPTTVFKSRVKFYSLKLKK